MKKLTSKKGKKKRKGLAHAIAQTTNRTTSFSEAVHETILEKATDAKGLGELVPVVPQASVNVVATQNI